jgi:hypothetical protein
MIDLLSQLAYVALVLAVISLFVCTLPIWLIVLVVVFLLGDSDAWFKISPYGHISDAKR